MSYRVSTQVYSGPFDLLLQLVTRQKVDIGAISISEVAEQYLAEAERIEALDLDVASDFLLVAATLLDIKAASLVPQEAPRKTDDDDEDDDAEEDSDEALYEVTCPNCGKVSTVDEETLLDQTQELVCPYCNASFDIELEGTEDEQPEDNDQ